MAHGLLTLLVNWLSDRAELLEGGDTCWGRKVSIQYRFPGSRRWHQTTIKASVAKSGSYSKGRLYFAKPTHVYLRWHYTGTTSGPWLSANAPAKLFWIT